MCTIILNYLLNYIYMHHVHEVGLKSDTTAG